MSYEKKIALRYIFSKRSFNFITVITFISILGITVGTAALIAVMSIFNGFQEITVKQIVGFDPHIRITPSKGNILQDCDDILNEVSSSKEVSSIAPIVGGKAVGTNGSSLQVFNLVGLSDDYHDFIDEIRNSVMVGNFHFNYFGENNAIVIGIALADKLGVLTGDSIQLFSPILLESSLSTFSAPQGRWAYIAGIFQTNIKDYDLTIAFSHKDLASKIYLIGENKHTTIDLRLNDFSKSTEFANKLQKKIGDEYNVSTWIDLNRDLYNVMQFERLVSFSIIGIIILIAVFNVLSSLVMTVTEKTADIGLLKALGATNQTIRKIFLLEGIFIGSIGAFLGTALGVAFVYAQEHFKLFRIDNNRYIIDAIPVSLDYFDVALVLSFALILSFIATIYPAHRASKVIAVEAIRGD